ncbi:Rieske 2Fe-2S domain-containing protein [Pelagibacterales bacterium SAG-MED35]|nr:Rieske 2Fe-2S domain-containing protein [Pelagibacterales bacterium SAG-MED35]
MINIKNQIKKKIDKEKIYLQENWFLVGAKSEFEKKNNFKTFNIFNQPIIIYKFKDKIKAFTNICPHRGSNIKDECRGNSVFNCIYHGWAFNSKGNFISAPYKDKAFPIQNIKNKKLTEWKLDFCNNLIFITKSNNKTSLKNFLGRSYKKLFELSDALNTHFSSKKFTWKCNWKLSIENAIDEYHAPILHKETFGKTLELNPTYNFQKKILSIKLPLNQGYLQSLKNNQKIFEKPMIDKYFNHYLFFPNTTFASTVGIFSFLQTYFPISENETSVTTDIFLSKTKVNKNNKYLIENMQLLAKKFNEIVFNQDRAIAENLHKNISNNFIFSNFGNYERRIKKFRKLLKS